MRPVLALATLALIIAAPGCRTNRLGTKGCQQDSDCGTPASAYRCETLTGVCYCRTGQACPGSQFCNTIGFCQDKAGCAINADCLDPSLVCDVSSGACVAKGRCSSDLQCELGWVCELTQSTCVPGCRTNGDCNGSSCFCGNAPCICTGTTPQELARCAVGVCDPNACATNDFCRYGESCGLKDGGIGPKPVCSSDYDTNLRPYCDSCTSGGGTNTCGTGANYCLIDTRHPGNFYCGADCGRGQSCPRGYACQDVIVVSSQWRCSAANRACPSNANLPCTSDAECKRGGSCVKGAGAASGFCAGKCGLDEGDTTGFCTCQVDADCAQETCSRGECSISRSKCVNDGDCRSIRCVDFEGGGGCLIGQNCAPGSGLSCIEVR